MTMTEGSIEVKLPTIWTDEKQRWEEAEKKVRRASQRREYQRRKVRESQKQKDVDVQKGRKVAKHCVVPMFCWSNSRLAQAAGAEPAGGKHISKSKCAKHLRSGSLLQVETSKKCTSLWRKADV